ncbi:hypothetical protein SESBI_45961 [Sesbania bispinosa]|nr:hypothetical protein SESBI_45961 [Sesbania bispinosa]
MNGGSTKLDNGYNQRDNNLRVNGRRDVAGFGHLKQACGGWAHYFRERLK